MYKIETPESQQEFDEYFHFRWKMLREPWHCPPGSEKDEYDQISHHKLVRDQQNNIIAVARMHLNSSEEAQIRHVAVATDYQKKGLGKFIVSALEAIAIEEGVSKLVTNSREQSVPFFTRCGYQLEGEISKEMGQPQRQQMVKHCVDSASARIHPKWCAELQNTWHETIPITEQMGIKLYQYTGKTLEARASLNKNINLHGTMFAGSIFSLATLTGWGLLFLQMKERGLTGDIVLGDGNVHYHKPVSRQPRAICNIESLSGKFSLLEKGKKSRFDLQVQINDGNQAVAEFKGVYWILPPRNKT